MGLFSSGDRGESSKRQKSKSRIPSEEGSTSLSVSSRREGGNYRHHEHRHRRKRKGHNDEDRDLEEVEEKPNEEELRRLRMEYYNKKPTERKRSSHDTSNGPVKDTKPARSSTSKKNNSGHARARQRSKARTTMDREDAGYVYNTAISFEEGQKSSGKDSSPPMKSGFTKDGREKLKGKASKQKDSSSFSQTNLEVIHEYIPTAHVSNKENGNVQKADAPGPSQAWEDENNDERIRRSLINDNFNEQVEIEPTSSICKNDDKKANRRRNSFVRPSTRRSSTAPATEKGEDDSRSVGTSRIGLRRRRSHYSMSNFGSSIVARHRSDKIPSNDQSIQEAKMVECLTCTSTISSAEAFTIPSCNHTWCHTCLRIIFEKSTTDPSLMPPRCCDQTPTIPAKQIKSIFDSSFLRHWNRKRFEAATNNRIYCPKKGCGIWITPRHITNVRSSSYPRIVRQCGKCRNCGTRVCASCGNRWHKNLKCPKEDEEKFANLAKENGWMKCYSCGVMVERSEGCNHMSCRCKAEWCMLCGAAWKTCDCEMFNEDVLLHRLNPGDALPDLARGAQLLQRHIRQLYPEGGQNVQDVFRHLVGFFNPPPAPLNQQARGGGYAAYRDAQAQQVRNDEELARAMQRMFDLEERTPIEGEQIPLRRVIGTRWYDPTARAWVRLRRGTQIGEGAVIGDGEGEDQQESSPQQQNQTSPEGGTAALASTMAGLNNTIGRRNMGAGRVDGWLEHVVVEEWDE